MCSTRLSLVVLAKEPLHCLIPSVVAGPAVQDCQDLSASYTHKQTCFCSNQSASSYLAFSKLTTYHSYLSFLTTCVPGTALLALLQARQDTAQAASTPDQGISLQVLPLLLIPASCSCIPSKAAVPAQVRAPSHQCGRTLAPGFDLAQPLLFPSFGE